MKTSHYYTEDHPQASGRKPEIGDHAYEFMFPLEDGNSIVIHCGDETMVKFAEFIGSMTLDDQLESSK